MTRPLNRTPRNASLALLAAAALLAAPLPHPAFSPLAHAADANPAEPQQGVYVRDSAIASDKFELGKRMERLKEWPKSADVYQEILEKYQDRVIPTVFNDKNQPIRYASVTVAVQQQLARWPQEGLAVYRARYEPAASALLDQARNGDYQTLHAVLSRYFVTDAGKRAAIRLIDLYLESGEFTAATWIGQRLLDWHPTLTAQRSAVLFRTAIAHHMAGNASAAAKLLDELKSNYRNDKATIAGRETNLVEALSAQLTQKPPIAVAAGDDAWRTFGGDPSRSALSSAAGTPGAKIFSIDLPGPNVEGLDERAKRLLQDANNQARSLAQTIGVMPVTDRGQLFFQDGYRIFGLYLESGVPLPGWAQTYSGARAGQYWLPLAPSNLVQFMGGNDQLLAARLATPRQHSLTLTDDAVLGVLGDPGMRLQFNFGPARGAVDSGTRLVCLDRATGKQRWIVSPRSAPDDQANVKNLSFSGSPLVVGDTVYVIARGSTAAGVEDCHVSCYNLATGDFRWSSYIASAQTAAFNPNGMPMATGLDADSLSHLAFASGRIFVLTNLGAVAAIDAYSGATAWLTLYPRSERLVNDVQRRMAGWGGWGNPNMGVATSNQDLKAWELNPVIAKDGRIFVLPSDGENILVYDAGTGEELKRLNREINYIGKDRTLNMILAVTGDKLVAAGSELVIHLNWSAYSPPANNPKQLDTNSVFYAGEFSAIRGRPFVTTDRIFVPTESGLAIIDLAKAKVERRFAWPADQGPGNVLVTRDHVVVSTAKSIDVYTDLEQVRRKYLAAIKADPGSAEARLTFAEMMFSARQLSDARQALDEAIQILGGLQAMRPGALRDRVFSDSLLFAQRLGAENSDPAIALANDLFDRAAAAAQNPSQQVNYRLARASFIESLKAPQPKPDYPRALRLYQEILNDPALRSFALLAPDGATTPAGKKAETAIADLIQKVGSSLYQPFEQESAAALAALAQSKNTNALLALAEQYPHSSAAPKALMQAASIYEESNQPRLASHVLRQLYWKYQQRYAGNDRARLAEAIARNYLRMGNVGAALGRLQRVSSMLPGAKLTGPLLTEDGQPLQFKGQNVQTLKEATAALDDLFYQQLTESLPDVNLPVPLTPAERAAGKKLVSFDPQAAQPALANVEAIIKPPANLPSAIRPDRAIVWSDGKLACLSTASPQPLWTSPILGEIAQGLAWLDKQLLIWNSNEAVLLDADTGKLLWKADLQSLPEPPSLATLTPDAPQPAAVNDRANVAMRRGRALQAQLLQAGPAPVLLPPGVINPPPDGRERILQLQPLSDRILLSTTTGRVLAVDRSDGKLLWQLRAAKGSVIQQLLATEDFTALRTTDTTQFQLIVLDTFTGQPIWRRRSVENQNSQPTNCALSADGMLVWTTQQTLAAKDLYEPGDAPTWEQRNLTFRNIAQPDQLLIWGQEILAVCDDGRFVARCSLRRGDEMPIRLASGASDPTTRLRITGSRLYIVNSKSLNMYHLREGTACTAYLYSEIDGLAPELLLTRHYAILPGLVKRTETGNDFTYALQAFSRALVPDSETRKLTESGKLDHRYDFTEPAKIKAWQALDGGLYYLSTDNKLHLLRGTRK